MSRVQSLVNFALLGGQGSQQNAVLGSASLTVFPQQQVYGVSANLPNAGLIVDVRDALGRSLDPIPFDGLAWLNQAWWREVGDELRSYCYVGNDLLILRPGIRVQQTVTVVYAAITAPLAVDSDTLQLPDSDAQLVLDPVEAMLDLKARDLQDVAPIIKRWMEDLNKTKSELR